eukprot:scaffold12668_cov96-Isochrysis_galbana.AAC.1
MERGRRAGGKRRLSELSAEMWGPPAMHLPPAISAISSGDLQREIDPTTVLPAVLRTGRWGVADTSTRGCFRSVAVMRDGQWNAHNSCELCIGRIVSQRRHHRSGVGSIGSVGAAASTDFAWGDIRVEQQGGERTPTGLCLPDHVCVHLTDGQHDASICGEMEGALEPDEMRLVVYLVGEGQVLLLGGRHHGESIVTEPGDIELYTAFRSRDGIAARCLMRWCPDRDR